ncbi:YeeE/YedE thiosulfate transporter family protein [Sphingobacterium kyonggiense]|uniref:YeeE/YedE thiosulfate transporter family protein n=1 Tax=Sphingobacterium kyonggiense TaxID=714075 RepID=A0ABP7YSA4_9SPHI
MRQSIYILLGVLFGIVMYKAEAASWFRIYEMFNFQSFHMFGFMATALAIGVTAFYFIKRSNAKDAKGQPISMAEKAKSVPRYLIGGILFGLGWALAGACPGPIFVLIGAGMYPMLIVAGFAILGTYLYGLIKDKLPH